MADLVQAKAMWCSARDAGFDAALELSSLDGSNGFVLNGIDAGDGSGHSVSGAGDINGDGFDDLIIGAPYGVTRHRRYAYGFQARVTWCLVPMWALTLSLSFPA